MTTPPALSLCTGTGALDHAVEAVTTVYAENDPWASRLLATRLPGVPNLGTIEGVDWKAVGARHGVRAVIAGWPCQGISNNGHRLGLDDPRSGLWREVAAAIDGIRPDEVFLENVAALKRRGLDVVSDHLNQLGYDLYWTITYASSVGAPMQRARFLGYATPGAGITVEVPAPAPTVDAVRQLLPTPKASDGPNGGPNQRDGAGNYYLPGLAVRLDDQWQACGRDYAPAIRRWETILGRPAPTPTSADARGNQRLSPAFTEWVMGYPAGWVTELTDMPRPEQIKRLGNGVVQAQAESGYRALRESAGLTAIVGRAA
ncbi:DNA cytosine methyltransferase [Streptomyces goshikiensis]